MELESGMSGGNGDENEKVMKVGDGDEEFENIQENGNRSQTHARKCGRKTMESTRKKSTFTILSHITETIVLLKIRR